MSSPQRVHSDLVHLTTFVAPIYQATSPPLSELSICYAITMFRALVSTSTLVFFYCPPCQLHQPDLGTVDIVRGDGTLGTLVQPVNRLHLFLGKLEIVNVGIIRLVRVRLGQGRESGAKRVGGKAV